jgi:hypothetical protein
MGSPTGAGLATPGPVSQLPTLRQMWLAKLKSGRQMPLVSGAEMPRDYCHLPYCFRDVSDLSGLFLGLDSLWGLRAGQPRGQGDAATAASSGGSSAAGSLMACPKQRAMFHVKQAEAVGPMQGNRLGWV